MKKTLLTLLSVLFCAISFAQSVPQGLNYQAIARDASGDVFMNQALTIQFSVISDITTSAISWQETQSVTTNDYGLFTAIIGQGTSTNVGSSATFYAIDWGASNHLLKVEVDYGGGFVDMGTTPFMSVPYSLHAKTAANGSTTDELQTLTISGDTLFISSGNWIILPSSSTPNLLGCTDAAAVNYDPLANTDDGSCLAIGDTFQGGIVFYILQVGEIGYVPGQVHGLIAAASDQSSGYGAEWGCNGTYIGTYASGIGTGNQNTIDIEAGCTTPGIAADICANYTDGTYSDWFLPSKTELTKMHINIGQGNALGLGNVGGFANNYYWSSTEYDGSNAWSRNFSSGFQNLDPKTYTSKVRAVRAF